MMPARLTRLAFISAHAGGGSDPGHAQPVRQVEAVRRAERRDVAVPGLVGALAAGGRFASTLLKGINPFSIWGVVLTATGVRVTNRLSKGSAYAVAIVCFVIALLVGVFFAVTCAPKTS